jgi:hypothetical protein
MHSDSLRFRILFQDIFIHQYDRYLEYGQLARLAGAIIEYRVQIEDRQPTRR